MKAVVGLTCFLSCCQLLNSDGVCEDGRTSCAGWAKANECVKNPAYMLNVCPVSCHVCGPCSSSPCPADKNCVSESTDPGANYTCICFDGYEGENCSDSPCAGVTCYKGGHCVLDATSSTGYICDCPTAISGPHCEECIDTHWRCPSWASAGECEVNPWMPNNCRISCPEGCPETDLCNPNPCQNGGTCNQNGTCNCTGTGFMGNTCEENNPCDPDPCRNGGTCNTDGSCNCTGTGFTGSACEVVICPHTMVVSGYIYKEVPVPDISTRNSLVFATRACQDAHMALSTSLDMSSSVVEIVIGAGANTYLTVRKCKQGCEIAHRSVILLSCNEFKRFWVSWEASAVTTIALGHGSLVGTDVIVTQSLDNVLDVNHVSIASYLNTVGTWVFDFPEQTNSSACTPTASPTTEMTTELPTTETPTTTTEAAVEPTTTAKPTLSPDQLRLARPATCRCTRVQAATAEDKERAQQAAAEIKQNLTISGETSSQKRRKTSAKDARPSAQSMGSLGIAILVFVLVLVTFSDLISIGRWLHKKLKRRRNRVQRCEDVDPCDSGAASPAGGTGNVAAVPNKPLPRSQMSDNSDYAPNPGPDPAEDTGLGHPSRCQNASEDTAKDGALSKTPGRKRLSVLRTLAKTKVQRKAAPTDVRLHSPKETRQGQTDEDDLDLDVITVSGKGAVSGVNRRKGISKKRETSTAWTEL